MTSSSSQFFIAGGTIPRDAASYIPRQADDDLLDGLRAGEFCYVLTSRQMGKSSLMVRTMSRLREEGAGVANLDLTAIGQNLSVDQWYDGLLNLLARCFDLEEELEEFWLRSERYSPLQRWMLALREVVLESVSGRIVLFVDEIDAVRSLPFSADEFFAAIRESYNRRAHDQEYCRLTFCLMGVATPSDLIQDVRTTPFNIGRRIELTDFTAEEAAPLADGLSGRSCQPLLGGTRSDISKSLVPPPKALLSRILYWTGGHPYLTQRLCLALADSIGVSNRPVSVEQVDRLCADLFLSANAQERDDNLIFVRERILRSEEDSAALLDLYAAVYRGKRVPNDETNPRVNVLQLAGIVSAQGGLLRVRNRIYERVFNRSWIHNNLPGAEIARQRRAYRRGLLRASAFACIVLSAMGWLSLTAVRQANRARKATSALQRSAESRKSALDEATRSGAAALLAAARAKRAEVKADDQARIARLSAAVARRSARTALDAAVREKHARNQAVDSGRREKAARRAATFSLRDSYLAQAQLRRRSGQPGQRFDSLTALAKAAAITPESAIRLKLRNEAIAAMALPADLREGKSWVGWPRGTTQITFDADLGNYARCENQGNVYVGRVSSHEATDCLPHSGTYDIWSPPLFSPDGRFRVVVYVGDRVVLWDIKRHHPVLEVPGFGRDFSPDGR